MTIRLFVSACLALTLVACTKETPKADPAVTPVAPAPAAPGASPAAALKGPATTTDAKATIELGKDVCSMCVDVVGKTLTKMPGVGAITIKQGDKDFSVAYDSKVVKPADLTAALVAAGEKGAKVKS
jgi:copper chaperone CopZ